MKVRAASIADARAIQDLFSRGRCWIGSLYLRDLMLEEKLVQSDISFASEDDEAPANYWFVVEHLGELTAAVELQTLAGYDLHCLSYLQSQILHRSDALGICHTQKLYSLDEGLLGMDQVTVGVTLDPDADALLLLLKHLLVFRSEQHHQPPALYLMLQGSDGPGFWTATGERLIGVNYADLRYAHAELLPLSQLPECFVTQAFSHKPTDAGIERDISQLGFTRTQRTNPLDGGAVWCYQRQA